VRIKRAILCALAAGVVLAAGCGQTDLDRKRGEARDRWDASRAEMATRLAEGCYQRNELGRARQHIEEVLKNGTTYAPAYVLAARLAAEKGELDKASEYASAAVQLDPDTPEGHYVLGTIEQTIGHMDKALDEYTTAAELGRNEAKYSMAQAETLVALDRATEALDVLQETVRRSPGKADAHTALGDVLALLKDPDGAIGCYRIALRLNPTQVGLKERLATTLFKCGSYGEAEPLLAELSAVDQKNAPAGSPRPETAAWIVQMRATCLLALGRTADARAVCRTEVQLRSDSASPLVSLALCDILENKLPAARQNLELALSREPQHVQANALMGYVLMETGKPGEAAPHLRLALKDPACDGRLTIERLLARAESKTGS